MGSLVAPQNEKEALSFVASTIGLGVYPGALTLTNDGATRQLLVGLPGTTLGDWPNLSTASSGTRYFLSRSGVVSVSPDGLLTSVGTGEVRLTAINGAGETVIPIRVVAPITGGSGTLGASGGAIKASDGSLVKIAPGALYQDTVVSISPLIQDTSPIALPPELGYAGSFQLDVGNQSLSVPAQLAIKAPVGLEVGTKVYLAVLRDIPNADGSKQKVYSIAESAVVEADGMIRTQSPPWNGVKDSETHYMLYASKAGYAQVNHSSCYFTVQCSSCFLWYY